MVTKEGLMTARRSTRTDRTITKSSPDLKSGSRVTVSFGRHDTTGMVLRKTVTGRYAVEVQVDGADEPVTTSYARSELQVAPDRS